MVANTRSAGQAGRQAKDAPDGMVWVTCAYRFRLDLPRRREPALLPRSGARRFAYNWGVAFPRDVRALPHRRVGGRQGRRRSGYEAGNEVAESRRAE